MYIRPSFHNGPTQRYPRKNWAPHEPNMLLQINLSKLYFLLPAGSKIIVKSEQRKITGELIRLQNPFGERRQKKKKMICC